MTNLIQYPLDPTGLEIDNLITDEIHANVDTLTGIIIPVFGDFFTESLVVKNNTDAILARDDDYVPIEFNQTDSLKYGKEICRGILVLTNKNLSPFKITYQALGGERSYSNENLLTVMSEKILPPQPVEFTDIYDAPTQFKPSNHLHDIEEVYGFERIVAALNRVKVAIEIGSFPAFQSLLGFLDSALLKIRIDMKNYLDDRMEEELNKFKEQFTAEYFGIDLIPNLKQAKEPDGITVGAKGFLSSSIAENKLMTIEALLGLKKVFFESFIRKQLTGLDLSRAVYGEPTANTIRDLLNRSSITVISKASAIANEVPYDDSVYPIEISDSSEFTIVKISNGLDNGSGDLLGFDQTTQTIYHGNVAQGWSGVEVNWKRNFSYDSLQELKETIQGHIDDKENPHEVTQEQVGLDKIVNLPVVTKQELDDITSVRSMLTFDSLLYFMRTHLLQNGPTSIAPSDSKNKFIIDNAVVVYSPGGGCTSNSIPTVTGLNSVIPTNTVVGWSVNGGKPNSKFIMTTGLIGREPRVTEYRLNSLGSYVGYINTGNTAGTIQSLFSFEDGESIFTNTIVEQNACVDEPIPSPVLVKLSQKCFTNLDVPDDGNPYTIHVLDKQLIGTYGYTGEPVGGAAFDQLIKDYSYCCGTRDPLPWLSYDGVNTTHAVNQIIVYGGLANSHIEVRVTMDDQSSSPTRYYFSTKLDGNGEATLNIHTGYQSSIQVNVEILFINHEIVYKNLVFNVNSAPATPSYHTVTHLRFTNNNPNDGDNLEVEVTATGLRVGEPYSFIFKDKHGVEQSYQNKPGSFIAENDIEKFIFNILWDEIPTIDESDFSITARVLMG